jgi:hypothetical protein
MVKYGSVAVLLVLSMSVIEDAGCDGPLVLERLVDSATPMPGGSSPFLLDNVRPAPCELGVVFAGTESTLERTGIYVAGGGDILVIADEDTLTPAGGAFDDLRMPECQGREVTFVGRDLDSDRLGVYVWTEGILRLVVEEGAPAPQGGGVLSGLNEPDVANGSVAFRGSVVPGGVSALYHSVAPVLLETVVDTATLAPGTAEPFDSFTSASLSSQRLAFRGFFGIGGDGIYSWSAGSLEAEADQETPVPGHAGTEFQSFSPPSVWAGGIVFAASHAAGQGVYRSSATGIEALFSSGDPAPGGGVFAGFDGAQAGPGGVAFLSTTSQGDCALFVESSGDLHRVVDVGDFLDGQRLLVITHGLGSGGLAFRGLFEDGSQAIYLVRTGGVAIPSASFGTLVTFAVGLAAFALLRLRRQGAVEPR